MTEHDPTPTDDGSIAAAASGLSHPAPDPADTEQFLEWIRQAIRDEASTVQAVFAEPVEAVPHHGPRVQFRLTPTDRGPRWNWRIVTGDDAFPTVLRSQSGGFFVNARSCIEAGENVLATLDVPGKPDPTAWRNA